MSNIVIFLHFCFNRFWSNWHFLAFYGSWTRLVCLLLLNLKVVRVSLLKLWNIWDLTPFCWGLRNLHFIINKFCSSLTYSMQFASFSRWLWMFRWIIQICWVNWNEMVLHSVLMLLLFRKYSINHCTISGETLAQLR